jgi:GNAT acetyltransferase-like protein
MRSRSSQHSRRPRRRRARADAAPALRLPESCVARSLSDPDSRAAVERWLRASPDHTLYHLPPYIDFLREQNGVADVLLVERHGNPLFALPVHARDRTGVDGGYSGVVFSPSASEAGLRRAIAALCELFEVNRRVPFRICQSAQAEAYRDRDRVTLLQCLFEQQGLQLGQVYGRLCALERLPAAAAIPAREGRLAGALALEAGWLAGEALEDYDNDARRRIRKALAAGLRVEYADAEDRSAMAAAYERFQPLHEESWARTGLLPKPPGHWRRLGEAIAAAGGEDVVALALGPGGEPLAGVICHLYRGRAIYWSGCSSAGGLALEANPLCLHGAILACRRRGAHTFELGRFRADEPSAKERAVTHYKAQFGGTLVRVASFSSKPNLLGRARAAQAGALFEAKRRIALARARAAERARRGREAAAAPTTPGAAAARRR